MMILFVILFVATMVIMLLYSLDLQRKIVTTAEKDLQNIIHSVHFSTQKLSSEQSTDLKFLSQFIRDAKENNAVQEITIVGSTNKVVASSNPGKVGRKQQVRDRMQGVMVHEQFGQIDSLGPHNRYEVAIPIKRDNKLIGVVETSFILNDLGVFVWRVFLKQSVIAIIALFTLFLIFYIAIRRMNKPVELLCRAADQVGSGDSTIHLEYKGSGELRRLIESFNGMAAKINQQRSLEDDLREMERKAILSETAAILAHEIRNPLNLINLSVDHLMDEYAPGEEERRKTYREMMKNVKQEAQRLNKMVGDFLVLGKPVRMNKTLFTLTSMISEVELLLKHQLIETHSMLEIDIQEKCELYADKEQMRLVFSNLLLNAIQVTGSRGRIFLKAQKEGSAIVIKISDNGPGIPEKDLEKIFEPYFSRRAGGTGLGLSLVKSIVQKHDGEVKAGNKEQGGACFTITLPGKETGDAEISDS